MIERIKHNMGEQVKNKTEIIILEEKTISSIVKDVFTFLCLFGMFYLNHKYTDGAGIIDFSIVVFILFAMVGVDQKRKKRLTPEEAKTKIDSIIAKHSSRLV